ncbi:MAG: antitoxin Xre/MbcA/ParS toxin-binding domain-containing protein [Chitinophagales bacterium]
MSKHNILSESHITYRTADDKSVLALISTAREGILYSKFASLLQKSPFSLSDWTRFLHLSERTMQRLKSEKRAFDPVSSEKILELTMLYKLGNEIFGTKEKFTSWLNRKNAALGNVTPKELLDSSFGVDLVKDELHRIEHGVLA